MRHQVEMKKAMNILYFSFVELDIPNACQTHTLGVLKGFSENGCSVDAVVPRPIKLKQNISSVRFLYIWPWQFSSWGILLAKIIATFYFLVLCLFNHYDAIYVRELEINPFPRWCSRIFKIPYYIEVNAAILYPEDSENSKKRFISKIERNRAADFKQAEALIVSSFQIKYHLISTYNLNKNKVHTLLNGTFPPEKGKINREEALSRIGLPVDGFYLGFLGNIWEYYDLNGLLEAMKICLKNIPSLHLIIVGGGPKTESFKQQASKMGLSEYLTFLGYIQPDKLYHIMGAMDVGLITLMKEGLRSGGPIPTRFATYAVFGVPVIVNDYMMKDYANDLLRGLSLVPPEDSRALAKMISWHYHHPKEMRENGQILRDYVLKKMTWKHVAKDILMVMRHCVPST